MSAAYFIISEAPVEGFDLFVNGKALAHASDQLDRLAAEAKVKPLMDFFSMDPLEVESLFGDLNLESGADETDPEAPDEHPGPLDEVPTLEEAPPEEWFEAQEGLTTVQALIQALQNEPKPETPDPFEPTPEAILEDLKEFEAVLNHLATQGIRWHLAVDF